MGLDFVGNPNKIEYDDIDEIGVDDYSDDENAEAFGNWIEVYESSEYDDADDFDYDPYEDFFSDSDTSNGSELPEEPFATNDSATEAEEEEEEEDSQQKSNNTITNNIKSTDLKVSEEMADPAVNEADSNT